MLGAPVPLFARLSANFTQSDGCLLVRKPAFRCRSELAWRRLAGTISAGSGQSTASRVTAISATAYQAPYCANWKESTMADIRTYEGWWDESLIDPRNERALLSAFVAALVVWAAAFAI